MVAGWVNSYFHSTTENCYYWANTDDLEYTDGTVFGPIQFKTIFSGAALTLAGATYIANPTIDLGNYITPGALSALLNNVFYITDYPAGGRITTAKTGGRQWSNSAIEKYLSNTYYLSNSSKFIENGGISSGNLPNYNLATVDDSVNYGTYNLNGGYGATAHGPCVNYAADAHCQAGSRRHAARGVLATPRTCDVTVASHRQGAASGTVTPQGACATTPSLRRSPRGAPCR